MLPSVRPSVCLSVSVPIPDSVPFAMCYVRVVASTAFDRGQHGRLRPRPNAISGGHIVSPRDILLTTAVTDDENKLADK